MDPPFSKLIYGFHMPLFFILSGYLWNNRNNAHYFALVKKNVKRYIAPYIILCGFNLVLHFVVSMAMGFDYDLVKYLLGILYSRGTVVWMPNCSPLWFLTAIFITLCIFDAVQRMGNLYEKYLVIGVMGICSYLLSYFSFPKLPWNIDTAMMAVVFVMFGQMMKQCEFIASIKCMVPIVRLLFLTLFVGFGLLAIVNNPVESVSFDNNQYGNVIFMIVGASSISLVIFYMCYSIHWKGFVAKTFSFFGRHTIFIMGFDYFSNTIASYILQRINLFSWGYLFLLKMMLLVIGILIWNGVIGRIGNDRIRRALSF